MGSAPLTGWVAALPPGVPGVGLTHAFVSGNVEGTGLGGVDPTGQRIRPWGGDVVSSSRIGGDLSPGGLTDDCTACSER